MPRSIETQLALEAFDLAATVAAALAGDPEAVEARFEAIRQPFVLWQTTGRKPSVDDVTAFRAELSAMRDIAAALREADELPPFEEGGEEQRLSFPLGAL